MLSLHSSDIVKALAIGGATGLGARGIKQMFDASRGSDLGAGVNLPKLQPASAKIPVPVTPEEAAELEAQGIVVKRMRKAASDFVNNFMLGGIGTAAAYGGWKVLDNSLDAKRRSAAQAKLDSARKRVEMLLSDQPLGADLGLHAQMKAAEDLFFSKKAFLGDLIGGVGTSFLDMLAPLAVPVGVGAAAMGIGAYNQSQSQNKSQAAMKAIKEQYQRQPEQSPEAELEPVLVEEDPAMLKASQVRVLGNKLAIRLEHDRARAA